MPIANNYPTVAPTLNLDFANSQSLDPRINFQRGTTGTYYDADTSVVAEQNLLLYSQNYSLLTWSPYNLFNGTLGSDLITNGTFTTDTTGWAGQRAMTIASVGGRCEATTSTQNRSFFSQSITTVVGQKYRLVGTVQAGTYTGNIEMSIGNVPSTPATTVTNPTAAVTMTCYFTATNTTSQIQFVAGSGLTAGLTFYVDDVVLQQMETAASTAPDNTSTAELITVDTMTAPTAFTTVATNSYMAQAVSSVANTPTTYSMYVKAGTNNFVALTAYVAAGTFATAVFDVSSTGALGETRASGITVTNISSTITSVGSGWFRCTITATFPLSAITNVITSFAPQATNNSFDGSVGVPLNNVAGRNLSIWGAQLEQKSGASAYTVTTTAAITNYIPRLLTAPINEPRFDFNPVTRQSLGLLMEQQSTNLLTYSSDYTQSVWTKNNSSPVAATNISPDGTLNAQSIVENTATTTHQLQVGTSQASNTTVTASIFFKSNGRPVFNITVVSADFSGNFSAFFNANTGLVGTTASAGTGTFSSATMTSVGNGWYRCRISGQPSTTASTTRIHTSFGDTEALVASGYTGNGTSGIFAWGAQLEATAFPTSYIPTVASQVTRAQDFATISGNNFSSWFNNQQGTVYCSFDTPTLGQPAMAYWGIDNGASNGYLHYRPAGSSVNAFVGSIGPSLGTITINTTQQATLTYNNSVSPFAASGSLNGATAVALSSPVQLSYIPTQLSLGKFLTNTAPITGHIRKFAYYPVATTATNLQALTGS